MDSDVDGSHVLAMVRAADVIPSPAVHFVSFGWPVDVDPSDNVQIHMVADQSGFDAVVVG